MGSALLAEFVMTVKAMSFQMLEYRLANGMEIDDRTLILIDEASKAGLKEWEVLAKACEKAGLRVIPVGDVRQSGAIECPGMLDMMLGDEGIPTSRLEVVRRHRDPTDPSKPHPWLARASSGEAGEKGVERPGYHDALYKGDAERAIAVLKEEGALNIHETREEAMVALVEKWHERRRDHQVEARETVLVVYGTNEDVDRVNALAQKKRLEENEIGGPSVRAVDRTYRIYAGDVVMLRETAFQPRGLEPDGKRPDRVENGTMGTVLEVDAEQHLVKVAFDAPDGGSREVTMDLGELRNDWERGQREREDFGETPKPVPSLRLSIAGHQFPLQGGTWWYTGSLWGDGRQRLEDVISGDARAKFILDVHVDRESLGWEGTDTERLKRKAKQLSEIRHKLPSLTHKVTPGAQILEPYSNLKAAPDLPLVEKADFERPAVRREWRDPLRHHRRLLGPERVAVLERRAEELAPVAERLGEEELEAAAERAEDAFARLDPPAAYESLRIERAKVLASTEVDTARRTAVELEEQAGRLRSPLQRRERRQLLEAVEARRREGAWQQRQLGKLVDRENALKAQGRHLDDWLEAEGEALALAGAAERELAARQGRERGEGLERAGAEVAERGAEQGEFAVDVTPGPAPDQGLDAGI